VTEPPGGEASGASMDTDKIEGRTSSTLRSRAFTLCTDSGTYGRRVSGAMESRAAVFTSSPQAVEVWSAERWIPGSLLGWRHDASGGCQVWVRLSTGATEESLWTGLESLRLPERHLAVAPEPADDAAATRSMRLGDVATPGPGRGARPTVVAVPRPAGRSAAVPPDELSSRAHHPAGRRRADSRVTGETAELPAVGSAGRHRAPAVPVPSAVGRHRAVDPGLRAAPVGHAPGASEPERRPVEAWRAPRTDEDLLTRPMRLGDLGAAGFVPRPAGASPDDSSSDV
jgi:hypothetical protein